MKQLLKSGWRVAGCFLIGSALPLAKWDAIMLAVGVCMIVQSLDPFFDAPSPEPRR